MNNILAIDPGASGGFAWCVDDLAAPAGLIYCQAMPATAGDVLARLRDILRAGVTVAVIEDVGGFVGGVGNPGSRMFTFGRSVGFIHGALMTLGVRIELVKPAKWQKYFSLGTARACGSKSIWKGKLKGEAQRRFPGLTVTLKTADALLILDYARKVNS